MDVLDNYLYTLYKVANSGQDRHALERQPQSAHAHRTDHSSPENSYSRNMDGSKRRKQYRSVDINGPANQMCGATKARCKKRFTKMYSGPLQPPSQNIATHIDLEPFSYDVVAPTNPETSSIEALPINGEEFDLNVHFQSSVIPADTSEESESTESEFSESEDSDAALPESDGDIKDEQPVYHGARLTVQQSVLLILAFKIRYNLPETALEHLLSILTAHLPIGTLLPRTSYYFQKVVNMDYKELFTSYYPCDECDGLVTDKDRTCSCGKAIDVKAMNNSGNFFVVFNIAEHIRKILTVKDNVVDILENMKLRRIANGFSEIWNGLQYKILNLGKHDISCTFNTDGVALFNSSNFSLWPILYTVNEMSYSLRRKNVCVAALWFGKGKPEFNRIFKPIVGALKDLAESGIVWEYMNKVYTSRIYFSCMTSDSIARCAVQGMAQHNAKYGCTCCLAKSTAVKNIKGKRVYLPQYPAADARSHENYLTCLNHKEKDYCGVHMRSILLDIPKFDIIKNCPIDYMHCVCLGVVKKFTVNWLDSKNHACAYYLGRQVGLIDNLIALVKVPYEIPRVVRPLTQLALWKANEWRSWIFLAPVVLKDHLPKEYLKHFSMLSNAMFILLNDNISEEQLL